MKRELHTITIRDGRVYFLWHHTETTESGASVKVGESQYSRGDNATEEGLAAWLASGPDLARAILAAEDDRQANAATAAEAARLAELERWNALTPEQQAAELAANAPPPPVITITPRQLSLWLWDHLGISDKDLEAQLPDERARIEWRKASEIRLDHPQVVALAASLHLNPIDVFRGAINDYP